MVMEVDMDIDPRPAARGPPAQASAGPSAMPQQQQQQTWGAPYQQQQQRQMPPMFMQQGAPYAAPFPMAMQGVQFPGPVMFPMGGAHLMAMHHPWAYMQHQQHMQHQQQVQMQMQMQAARRMRHGPPPAQQPQHARAPPAQAAGLRQQPPGPQGRPGALGMQQPPAPAAAGHPAVSKSAARAVLVQPLTAGTARQAQAAAGGGAAAKGALAAAGADPVVCTDQDMMDLNRLYGSDSEDEAESPETMQNDGSSGWAWLVDGVLQQVVGYLQGNNASLSAFRATCANWKACADSNLRSLSPKALLPKDLIRLFPVLEDLQLVACRNVRNRDLYVLANNNLHLTSLVLGDDTNKPWVTNRGIESIAKMTKLKFIALHDCNSITNNGITAISALTSLDTLSLRGCRKLTNNGMSTIKALTNLTKLNMYGCKRLSCSGMSDLVGLPLKALALGQTRIRGGGLEQIGRLTQLTELHLVKEEVALDHLLHLSGLTALHTLALRDMKLTNPVVSAVLSRMTQLKDLSLYKNVHITDAFILDTERLHNLTALDLRETSINDSGLAGFTALVNLRVLRLKPLVGQATGPPLSTSYPRVRELTQLRSLTMAVPALHQLLMESIGALTGLQELDLGRGFVAASQAVVDDQVLHAGVYAEIAKLTSLTSLDLSRRRAVEKQEAEDRKKAGKPRYPKELRVMLEALPHLRYLNLGSTAIEAAAVKKLIRKFPAVNIDGRKSMSESTPDLANYGLAGTLCVL